MPWPFSSKNKNKNLDQTNLIQVQPSPRTQELEENSISDFGTPASGSSRTSFSSQTASVQNSPIQRSFSSDSYSDSESPSSSRKIQPLFIEPNESPKNARRQSKKVAPLSVPDSNQIPIEKKAKSLEFAKAAEATLVQQRLAKKVIAKRAARRTMQTVDVISKISDGISQILEGIKTAQESIAKFLASVSQNLMDTFKSIADKGGLVLQALQVIPDLYDAIRSSMKFALTPNDDENKVKRGIKSALRVTAAIISGAALVASILSLGVVALPLMIGRGVLSAAQAAHSYYECGKALKKLEKTGALIEQAEQKIESLKGEKEKLETQLQGIETRLQQANLSAGERKALLEEKNTLKSQIENISTQLQTETTELTQLESQQEKEIELESENKEKLTVKLKRAKIDGVVAITATVCLAGCLIFPPMAIGALPAAVTTGLVGYGMKKQLEGGQAKVAPAPEAPAAEAHVASASATPSLLKTQQKYSAPSTEAPPSPPAQDQPSHARQLLTKAAKQAQAQNQVDSMMSNMPQLPTEPKKPLPPPTQGRPPAQSAAAFLSKQAKSSSQKDQDYDSPAQSI